MRWPRTRPAPVRALPLAVPRLDGSGWTDPALLGRPSFAASTYAEMGNRRAYEPEAHARADRLVAAALPRLTTGAADDDAPYLRKVFLTAARVGVGLGLVEAEQTGSGPGELDRDVAGALELARRALPTMREDWARTAGWFVLAGHALGRAAPGAQDAALAVLLEVLDP